MVKCRVCAWRKSSTCHNLETRGEIAPPPSEMRHLVHADHDNEMPDPNDAAGDDEMLHDCANLHILESLREEYAAHDNIHPTPSEKEIYSSLQLKVE